MTTEQIKNGVTDIVAKLFIDNVFETSLIEYANLIDDYGMDSITFISLVVEIEIKFCITIADEKLTMENFKTVDDIVSMIECEFSRQ